ETLVEELGIDRDTSRNPLFDVLFNYVHEQKENQGNHLPDLEIEPYRATKDQTSKFDLSLSVVEIEDVMHLNMSYRTDLFTAATAVRFINYFTLLMDRVLSDATLAIAAYEVMPETERKLQLEEFNQTQFDFSSDQTVMGLFLKQVQNSSDATALIFNETYYTYRELDERSTILAATLYSQGLRHGEVVAVLLERSCEVIISMLAILKCRACYLPLNAKQPLLRTQQILQESNAKLVLTTGENQQLLGEVRCIDPTLDEAYTKTSEFLTSDCQAGDNAYIIYTSGSTGTPKGVVIRHSSLLNYITHQTQFFNIEHNERILQFSAYYFDASLEQIWIALTSGAALVLVDEDTILDPRLFTDYIKLHRVSHLHATPSYLELFSFTGLTDLKRIVSGGELCKASLALKFMGSFDFYNKYGPTETTITSVECKVDKDLLSDDRVSIGRPVGNTSVYILDKDQKLLPTGVVGEIYIGGAGISAGYLNREDLTASRFIPNPFSKEKDARLYRTGDLAYWRADGNLMFTGRADNQ
ncbi:amino acid adenylation domain-containing protein, partial [Ascidiimonas sp. W6]|uniref:non-ribosomal peptide synthetase n=1 Tax=Ascidiimonas meishanensis TaxID=3128903 RepID=UPI0030EDA58D